jgi:hypothetical protein
MKAMFALAGSLVCAQACLAQNVPPPPKPDTGPSLEVTMKFIVDKLNDIGEVSSTAPFQKSDDGSTGNGALSFEVSKVIAYPSQCRVSYHRNSNFIPGSFAFHDPPGLNTDDGFGFREVEDIVVLPLEKYLNESWARSGNNSAVILSTSPAIFALVVRRPHGAENMFAFYDATLADRVAKAMTHAVELCGGGNREPF